MVKSTNIWTGPPPIRMNFGEKFRLIIKRSPAKVKRSIIRVHNFPVMVTCYDFKKFEIFLILIIVKIFFIFFLVPLSVL